MLNLNYKSINKKVSDGITNMMKKATLNMFGVEIHMRKMRFFISALS